MSELDSADVALLVRIRRMLHQTPEVGLRLPHTKRLVLAELGPLDLEVATGSTIDSVVAILRGTHPDRRNHSVLLRGDMDALPIQEQTGLAFASLNGAMHGCGHDLHTAMLVGAARVLSSHRSQLRGDVIFMFQPGEEGHDGAQRMLDDGLLDAAGVPVVAAYGLHVFSARIAAGRFLVRPGAVMSASDLLTVRVVGRGGHGSTPHRAADPIAAAAEMVTALHVMITRRFDVFDPVVLSITEIHAGHGSAIIPDEATFVATVRSYSPANQVRLEQFCGQVVTNIAAAHGLSADISYRRFYPATLNDPNEARAAADIVTDLFGSAALISDEAPLAASEDFSRVLQRVPGVFIPLGATPEGADPDTAPFNHSPLACFNESVLPQGALLLAHLAVRRLGRGV